MKRNKELYENGNNKIYNGGCTKQRVIIPEAM